MTFNPDGVLTGASFVTAAGHRLYMTTPRGLFVIDCTDPMNPRLAGQFTGNFLRNPHCVAIQFRYAFVTDDDGLKVFNITDPDRPVPVSGGVVRLQNPGRLYVARTYAYVANGPEGLAIIDVENPERPRLDQMFNAGGLLNDTRAVQIGSVKRLAIRARRRWAKWLARRAAHLTRYGGRRPGIQSATESEIDRNLSDERRNHRGLTRARTRPRRG